MAGHSKWASIKHKKAATDAKKGKAFTQVSNMITIAAKSGGDPGMNPSLALAIEKAKAVNMPKANIERAIKKGTGELGGAAVEEILYEGYGPSGVAILIETATDNKNRSVSEIRAALTKRGGSMASSGAVSFLFERLGQIELDLEAQELKKDEVEEIIINSGAKDFDSEGSLFIVYTEPAELAKVRSFLIENKLKPSDSGFTYISKSEVEINDKEKVEKILNLIDTLESLDDVISVHHNLNTSDEILKELN